jgi:NTE family protein
MEPQGCRVGLVLGAGGVAGGAFHAGVLAALEERTGWDPRRAAVVVGTSAGSVTGASLRAGLSSGDLLARAEGRPLSPEGTRLMRSAGPPLRTPPRPPRSVTFKPGEVAGALARAAVRPMAVRPSALLAGLLPEGPVSTEAIAAAIGGLWPDQWPADPLWVCAVRRADGRRVVFGRNDRRPPLGDAVAASCAIPGFFTPVIIDGEEHLDGGVHSPTNADVLVRAPELDLVVVSSPMSQRTRRPRLGTNDAVRRWASAVLDFERLRLLRLRVPVVVVEPSAQDIEVIGPNAMDPDIRAAVAAQARRSALDMLGEPAFATRLAPLDS